MSKRYVASALKSRPEHYNPGSVRPYPRPPEAEGARITRECRAEYRKAWKNLTRGAK